MFIFNFIVNKGGKEEESNRVLEHRVVGDEMSFRWPSNVDALPSIALPSGSLSLSLCMVEDIITALHASPAHDVYEKALSSASASSVLFWVVTLSAL